MEKAGSFLTHPPPTSAGEWSLCQRRGPGFGLGTEGGVCEPAVLQLPTPHRVPEPGLLAPRAKHHLLSPHQTPASHPRAVGPAKIWVPGWETWGGGVFWRCSEMLRPIAASQTPCGNGGCDEGEKVLKLIKEPKSCPTKGFLPLLCFSKHYLSHLLKHNIYDFKKNPN